MPGMHRPVWMRSGRQKIQQNKYDRTDQAVSYERKGYAKVHILFFYIIETIKGTGIF